MPLEVLIVQLHLISRRMYCLSSQRSIEDHRRNITFDAFFIDVLLARKVCTRKKTMFTIIEMILMHTGGQQNGGSTSAIIGPLSNREVVYIGQLWT